MTEHQCFENIAFNASEADDEYHNCTFIGCDFSNRTILNTVFEKCTFRTCNLALSKWKNALREVTFTDCKLTGADLTEISKFSGDLTFVNSLLDYCNLTGTKLRRSRFSDCQIYEGYYDEADLSLSVFERCNLERSSFFKANLEKADFSSAFNFSINPDTCRIKKTIFSEYGLRGLVAHLDIEIK